MAEQRWLFLLSRSPNDEIEERLSRWVISDRARAALSPSHNWHQSWSSAHPPHMRESLLRLCSSIEVPAFELPLVRAVSSKRGDGAYLWKLAGAAQKSEGFVGLLNALRNTSPRFQIVDGHKHSPHVTLAYFSPEPLIAVGFQPVPWLVDHVELVQIVGSGRNYRYETLFRKNLATPDSPATSQANLF